MRCIFKFSQDINIVLEKCRKNWFRFLRNDKDAEKINLRSLFYVKSKNRSSQNAMSNLKRLVVKKTCIRCVKDKILVSLINKTAL